MKKSESLFFNALLILSFSLFHQSVYAQLIGRTSGKLPFLQYAMGEDRLGAAKMSYLDSNVLLNITDSVKDFYKVQLAKNFTAFTPKQNVKFDTIIKPRNYLSASGKTFGDSLYDYALINLDARLPYQARQKINPTEIEVDIYGVASNSNWFTQLSTNTSIANYWLEPVADDVIRLHIQLNTKTHWGYYIYYNKNQLVIRVKRQPKLATIKGLKIAIDAGHGGANTGATGKATGVLEKDMTYAYAKSLEKALLKKYANVYMTRQQDTDITMIDRTLMLRAADPNLLISIHFNSAGNDTVRGTSTYYRYIGFRPFSQAILQQMLTLNLKEYGNIGHFNFALSGPTEYPNCLVEVAFLSNVYDEKLITDESFKNKVAEKIVKGIQAFLNEYVIVKKETPKPIGQKPKAKSQS